MIFVNDFSVGQCWSILLVCNGFKTFIVLSYFESPSSIFIDTSKPCSQKYLFLQANQPTSGQAATDGPGKVKEKEKEEIDEKQEKEEPLDKEALDSFTNSVVTG